MDSMLLQVCIVIDHSEHQNVVKTSVTHLPAARVPLPFLPHFYVICDLLLNRSTATLVHVGRVTSFPSSLSHLSRDPGCVPHDLEKGQIHIKCEILMSLYIHSLDRSVESAICIQWTAKNDLCIKHVQCFQFNLCKYRSASSLHFLE